MTWSRAETPQDAFGYREKPYVLSGLLHNYKDFLNEAEMADLMKLLGYLYLATTVNSHSESRVLLVGTAASGSHHDVDILVCSEPRSQRSVLVEQFFDKIVKHNTFKLEGKLRSKGSVETFSSSLFTPQKIYAMSYQYWNVFDISFVGVNSGSWDEVLNFHSRTGLAHAIVV